MSPFLIWPALRPLQGASYIAWKSEGGYISVLTDCRERETCHSPLREGEVILQRWPCRTAILLNCIYCKCEMTRTRLPVGPAEPWSAIGPAGFWGGRGGDGGFFCTYRMCAWFAVLSQTEVFPFSIRVFFFTFFFSQNNFVVTQSSTCTKSDAVMSYSCNAHQNTPPKIRAIY